MICKFTGKFRFLSNFYRLEEGVVLDDVVYPTVEHAYQAAKTNDPAERMTVLATTTPGQAKRAGRKTSLRPDWEKSKVKIMAGLVRQKFGRHSDLAEKLIATGEAELVEGNNWGDRFWGVCKGKGKNYLGRILMCVRDELREQLKE